LKIKTSRYCSIGAFLFDSKSMQLNRYFLIISFKSKQDSYFNSYIKAVNYQLLTLKQNITIMKTYESLIDATNDLFTRGYTANLSLEGDTIDDKAQGIHMGEEDFVIDEFYRFEGASNPDDMSIVYAVSSQKYNLKGVLVNAYGTYADDSSSAIHAKLRHGQVSDNLHGQDRPHA
jgi:hypothetical protein